AGLRRRGQRHPLHRLRDRGARLPPRPLQSGAELMASLDTPVATAASPRHHKKRRPTISWFQWLTLAIVAIFVVVPLFVTILGGCKEIGELRSNPFGLPQSWDPVRFVEILTTSKYFQSMANSLIIAVGSVILSLIVAS